MTAILSIPFFPWGLLLVVVAYLVFLAYAICLGVAGRAEEKARARYAQEPQLARHMRSQHPDFDSEQTD